MNYYGREFGSGRVADRAGTFFQPWARVLVLDVDGVVVDGKRIDLEFDRETLRFAQEYPDVKRVYWSSSDNFGIDQIYTHVQKAFREHSPLNQADLYIAGSDYDTADPVKNLRVLTMGASIVAVEDDRMFTPSDKVVYYDGESMTPSYLFTMIRRRFAQLDHQKGICCKNQHTRPQHHI